MISNIEYCALLKEDGTIDESSIRSMTTYFTDGSTVNHYEKPEGAVTLKVANDFDKSQVGFLDKIVFDSYKNIDGQWYITHKILRATEEETTAYKNGISTSVRIERNKLLAECDWTQLPDCSLSTAKKQAWTTYRQALRDLSDQPKFPYEIDWPVKPE